MSGWVKKGKTRKGECLQSRGETMRLNYCNNIDEGGEAVIRQCTVCDGWMKA